MFVFRVLQRRAKIHQPKVGFEIIGKLETAFFIIYIYNIDSIFIPSLYCLKHTKSVPEISHKLQKFSFFAVKTRLVYRSFISSGGGCYVLK